MVNIVAIIGVLVTLISIILFVLNGLYFQDREKLPGITNAEKSRVNALMIVNYVFAGIMGLVLIYFIYESFRGPKVVTSESEYPVAPPLPFPLPTAAPAAIPPRGQALLQQPSAQADCNTMWTMPQGCQQQESQQLIYTSPSCVKNNQRVLYVNETPQGKLVYAQAPMLPRQMQ